MIYISFFFSVTFFVYFFFQLRKEKKSIVNRRISKLIQQEEEAILPEQQKKSLIKRIIEFLLKYVKRSFRRKMPEEKEKKIELSLLQAGSPFGMTAVEFRLFQIGLFFLGPVLFGLYGYLYGMSISAITLLSLIGVIFALYFPHSFLKGRQKKRSVMAVKELPDILDLLTVSLEAGLGFDSAVAKVVSRKSGVLSDELHRCLEEIRLGRTRREALSGIKDRLVSDEIRLLISSILQAEKLGIGMVHVLRIQSTEVRDRRRQRAEEMAMKAPVKMLFPLVLFIFPSIFIVLLGPAVIQFISTFK